MPRFSTGKVRWASDRPGHATVLAADGKLLLWNDAGRLRSPGQAPGLPRVVPGGHPAGRNLLDGPGPEPRPALLRTPTRAACVFVGSAGSVAARSLPADPIRRLRGGPVAGQLELALGRRAGVPLRHAGAGRTHRLVRAALWVCSCRLCSWRLQRDSHVGCVLVRGAVRLRQDRVRASTHPTTDLLAQTVFWSACFVLGIAATSILNRLGRTFVFTWPVCLVVASNWRWRPCSATGGNRSESGCNSCRWWPAWALWPSRSSTSTSVGSWAWPSSGVFYWVRPVAAAGDSSRPALRPAAPAAPRRPTDGRRLLALLLVRRRIHAVARVPVAKKQRSVLVPTLCECTRSEMCSIACAWRGRPCRVRYSRWCSFH